MAERYGSVMGLSDGEVAAESFDVVFDEWFETLNGGAGEVGIEGAAVAAVIGVRTGVLDVF